MHELVNAVRRDHDDFRGVLDALRTLTANLPDTPRLYDTARLRSILHYFQIYLERYHHPKEDRLFATLRRSEPRFRSLLNGFESEHARSAALLAGLGSALTRYESQAEGSRGDLQKFAEAYTVFHLAHMREEESLWRSLTQQEIGTLDELAVLDARRPDSPPLWQADIESGFVALARQITEMSC